MRIGTQNGGATGRIIKDKTYFMTELRQKISLLSGELNRLNSEHDSVMKENANILAFEKR